MTTADVKKIENRVIGDSIAFLLSKSPEVAKPNRDFDVVGFRKSATKLKKSWKEKDANSTFSQE